MRRLAVGDIHGNFKGFKQALERAQFDYENDLLISLGDIVDGHSQSKEVLDELLKIKHKILIEGNHDQWFKEFALSMFKDTAKGVWVSQGGKATLESYGYEAVATGGSFSEFNIIGNGNIPEEHKELLSSQMTHYISEDGILFIHGGFHRHFLLSEQSSMIFAWDRDLWAQALSWESMGSHEGYKPEFKIKEPGIKKIFIGHTSTQFWDKSTPMKAAMITNLDTGGGWWGKITIYDIDSDIYYQSDSGKSLYPEFKGR